MRVIIIEDNPVDLENLRILLEGFDRCQLVGSATTIGAGMELARRERPDLILADIQLGSEISLDYLGDLEYDPFIICTTLYDRHALQAFDVGAADYLTKPVNTEKLARALDRVSFRASQEEAAGGTVLLKIGSTTRVTPFDQIILVAADRDYSAVLDQEGVRSLCGRRMHEWAQLLPEAQFVSLDRSTIVNRRKISTFTRLNSDNKAEITFLNGHTVEIGPTAFSRLQNILCE